MKPVRLLPLLAVAAICLFALKVAGLMAGGGFMLSGAAPAGAQSQEPARKAETKTVRDAASPQAGKDDAAAQKTTASKATEPDAAKSQSADGSPNPKGAAPETPVASAGAMPEKGAKPAGRGAEKDILKSLADRRKQLDQRARELQLRENLLKVAENRVASRIQELKAIEQRIETKLKKKDDERDAEYAKLVSLYSKMKPKDAARIFDGMDVTVLTGIVRQMNARTVSPILAEMDPAMAQRVTMQIAADRNNPASDLDSLPKISGNNPG